jgi:dienelactone hydrolase
MKNIIKIDPVILQSNYNQRPYSLDISYLPDNHPKPVILHIHGFKGFKDWGYFNQVGDYFAKAGFVFIKMNFSQNGTTPENPVDFVDLEAFGNNNFTIEQQDMGQVIDFIFSSDFPIKQTEFNLDDFYLTGHSRGGAAVILKAYDDNRVKALSTWAAINDLSNYFSEKEIIQWKKTGVVYIENSRTKQLMPLYYQLVENYMQNESKLDVPHAIKNLKKPFLVIHGSKDPTVLVKVAYQTQKWNSDIKLRIIEGADHVFGGTHPYDKPILSDDMKEVADATIDFFKLI